MENNKKKIVIGSIIGAISLLLIIVSVAFSKGNNDNVEVASITEETEETEAEEVEAEEVDTPEPDTEEPEEEEAETEEPDTPEPDTEEPETEEPDIEDSGTEEVDKEEVSTEPTVVPTTSPATTTTTSNSWGTPQEYHGDPEGKGPGRIIVKGFDYNDFFNGLSWRGEYWTASNGVEIKIVSVEGERTGMVPVPDGKGKDNEPTSPFQAAMAEASGKNINNYVADLNVTIPLATYKRTEIDINDANLVAYRNAYDYKLFANRGRAEDFKPYEYGDPINMRFAVASDGIGEFDSLGAQFWRVRRVNDYWEVRINGNLAAFRWDGIHQVLRYLSPDGDSLYQLIYDDFYTGRQDIIPEYDEWYAYQNSQIMLEDTEEGYVIYRFK